MIIKGLKENYETFLEMIQFEITGKCNMKCNHCRAWEDPRENISIETIKKVLDFALPEASKEVRFTISGGEPLLHPRFFEILELIKNKVNKFSNTKLDHSVITTNGFLLNKEIISKIENIGLGEVFVQVSIDSHDKSEHDGFRNFQGAFSKAVEAIKLVSSSKLIPIMRSTITPNRIDQIEEIIKLAKKCNVKRVSLGPVIPTGKAKIDKSLLLSPEEKKTLINTILTLRLKYPGISISTEDPVKFSICPKEWDYGEFDYKRKDFIGGCSAGIINMNVLSDGTITPCSMMLTPIVNVKEKSPKEILKIYTSSDVISNLVERNVKGKCGICKFKRLCGGCRATAEGITGDYLEEDPTCWKVNSINKYL